MMNHTAVRVRGLLNRALNSIRARRWHAAHAKDVPLYQAALTAIVHQHSELQGAIVFPPGLGWSLNLFQRPQQLARALARQGDLLVIYMEPAESPQPNGFLPLQERLYLAHVPIETMRVLPEPFVYILTWNARALGYFNAPRVVYDFVDDLSAFEGEPGQLARDHAFLLRSAHVVLASAERLYQQVQTERPDARLCPNGVDYDHFIQARDAADNGTPQALAQIRNRGQPVIGYFGALARWFDYALLAEVADRRQDLSFVLIGPDHDHSLSRSRLLRRPNLHWLGVVNYAQLPSYLASFDVAIIPFLISPITHATSPLKLFEYMAGGKPVVITPMRESMRYPGVLVANGPDEFAQKLDQALALRHDRAYLDLIDEVARANTWDTRAGQILAALRPLPPV